MAGARRVLVEPPVFPVDGVRQLFAGSDVAVETRPRPWTGDDVVGLLVWQAMTEEDMARLPALRVIATGSTGFDHIDTNAATRRRIWVCNVPEYCVEEVADSTIALLLALLRGVVVLDRSVRAGVWDDHAGGPLPRVSDTRLGIAGFGRIGRAVARRALGLGIVTWASDPLVAPDAIAAAGVTPASLESGQLAGAALDVLPVEPPTRERLAPRHPRLIVTPHAAWYSPAAEEEV